MKLFRLFVISVRPGTKWPTDYPGSWGPQLGPTWAVPAILASQLHLMVSLICFLPRGQHSSLGLPNYPGDQMQLHRLLNSKKHYKAVFIHPTTSVFDSSSRCPPLPPWHYFCQRCHSQCVYIWVLVLLRKGVMFCDGRNWFSISSTVTASFPDTLAIWPTLWEFTWDSSLMSGTELALSLCCCFSRLG